MRRALPVIFLILAISLATSGDERRADRGNRGKTAPTAVRTPPRFSEQVRRLPASGQSIANHPVTGRAAAMLSLAAKQDAAAALTTLMEIAQLDLPAGKQTDRIRAATYEALADLYTDRPSKQVRYLAMAYPLATTTEHRARLESRIHDLGGDLFVLLLLAEDPRPTRDPGMDDSCAGAIPVATPHSEIMNITVLGDHNWRSFDLPGSGNEGAFFRIETISDFPGSGTDDTDLGLWDGCPGDGGTRLAFNDDTGTDFTSRIFTECLGPGTYYVEVGGFFDSATADNFTLEIEKLGDCVAPIVDGFEPDDAPGQAAEIGLPTSTPAHAHGWGRARKEIQGRSIAPFGDVDHAQFALERNELVRVGTAKQFPTFFNNFAGGMAEENPDTTLRLYYENEPDYGGRCNQPDLGFLPICYEDSDCPHPLDNPLPLPWDCIPLELFGIPWDDSLVFNDDRSPSDRGSEILTCLPRSGSNTPSATLQLHPGGFLAEIAAYSDTDRFLYELQVKNEVGCLFEIEPNNAFEDATPLEIGTTVSGFFDYVVTKPYQDADLYRFDFAEDTTFQARPTARAFHPDWLTPQPVLELFVGPDDFGSYYQTLDDDSDDPLIEIVATFPPASELLGNAVADADYYLNVTNNYFNPNYYYDFRTTLLGTPVVESEPNDSTSSANGIDLGQRITAEIGGDCDVDTFRFELPDETFVDLSTSWGGDAAIRLIPCDGGPELSCDDDSGGAMRPHIDGCLPAGSYCAEVRAFAAADRFDYEFRLDGTTGCSPTDPPTMSGDRSFSCLDFASCF